MVSNKEVRTVLLDQELGEEVREFILAYNSFSEDHTMWFRYLKGFKKKYLRETVESTLPIRYVLR